MNETGGFNFSVQDLVDRAGLSLRSFYQHFDGKEDLLLALFEEQMAHFVENVEADMRGVDRPVDLLETLIHSFLDRVRRSPEVGGRALTEFQVRLAVEKPGAYARATAPLFQLVSSVVEEGQRSGEFRSDIGVMGMTLLINATLVSIAQMAILRIPATGEPLTDEHIIGWCRSAISAAGASARKPSARRIRSRR
jgi:AcrR family transcriptional regulator